MPIVLERGSILPKTYQMKTQKITMLSLSKIWIVTDSHELEECCRFRVDESEMQHHNLEVKTENIPEVKQTH
jgi:hypothetical protein